MSSIQLTFTSSTIKAMNGLLHYRINGHGHTVVFLHGMAGSSRYWEPVTNTLPQGYRSITLDLLGFGHSPKPSDAAYSYDNHLHAVTTTLDTLSINKPITLVGHSMGALLALRLACKQPQLISRLILISLPLFPTPSEAQHELTHGSRLLQLTYYGRTSRLLCNLVCANPLLGPWVYRRIFSNMPVNVANDIRLHTWTSYDRSRHQIIEHQVAGHDLETVAIPTTLIMGQNDPIYANHPERFANLRPNIKLIITKAGHHLPLENPGLIAGTIAETT